MALDLQEITQALDKWEKKLIDTPIDGQVLDVIYYVVYADGSGHINFEWRDIFNSSKKETEDSGYERLLHYVMSPQKETKIEFESIEDLEIILREKNLLQN